MRQRVLQGLKEQGTAFEYPMKIQPWRMEAQLRRGRKGLWGIKTWGQRSQRGVSRRRRVRRISVALEWMDSQACVSGKLMWNLTSFIVRRALRFLGGKIPNLI